MLEPADSAECREFTRRAFEISEKYDTPVFLRLVTRIAHARSLVEEGEREETALPPYEKDARKFVMMPGYAKGRHVAVEAREKRLEAEIDSLGLNRVEMADTKIGVVCSGSAYQYVKEALPNASVLKLGMVYPLPEALIRDFAGKVEQLLVVEELEPYFEDAIKAMGIPCSGKDKTGLQGELFVRKVGRLFGGEEDAGPMETPEVPQRPPVLCPGCPHRAVFYVLKKMNLTVAADIGCYTLGAMPPLNAVDSVVCMGASIGMALGLEKARGRDFAKHTVAVIGDSTFVHSGITGLVDVVYNQGNSTVIIVDNSTTGMTGHQPNPTTGQNVRGEIAPQLDVVKLCQAIGVPSVRVVDPFDMKLFEQVLREECEKDGPSVVIARRPCALLIKKKGEPCTIDAEVCRRCGMCLRIGCPALVKAEDGSVSIDASLCTGCGLCKEMCNFGAIKGGER